MVGLYRAACISSSTCRSLALNHGGFSKNSRCNSAHISRRQFHNTCKDSYTSKNSKDKSAWPLRIFQKRSLHTEHFDERYDARSSTSISKNFSIKAHASCRSKLWNQCMLKHEALAQHTSNAEEALKHYCGEDSFFISGSIMGVADGVGGWNENGVDPGRVSRSLMYHANASAAALLNSEDKCEDHVDKMIVSLYSNGRKRYALSETPITSKLLKYAYDELLNDNKVEAGSSTACIIQINSVKMKNESKSVPVLTYTNLGDSGLVIIRDGSIIFRSEFQYYGRAPYQLAKIPPRFQEYGAIENKPEDANVGIVELKVGDIIVLATDGVWDNFAEDLNARPQNKLTATPRQELWHPSIRSLVDVVQQDVDEAAPNIIKACVVHNLKPDDITVIVAQILEHECASEL